MSRDQTLRRRSTLTTKFIVAALAVVCAVLSGSAAISIGRERALFERDMTHDAQSFAKGLAVPFSRIWGTEGEAAARAFLAHVESHADGLRLGWEPINLASENPTRGGSLKSPLAAGSWRSIGGPKAAGELVTLVRIDSPGSLPGALSVRESLEQERRYVGASVRNHVITIVVLLGLAGLGMWFVGRHFVGRPVDLLVAKARRAGGGDLAGPVVLKQRDELRELADEMNQMCDRLATSRRHLDDEIIARIAAVEQLRHAERLATVGRLASGVAHELGTPLNVVLGRASVLLNAKTPEEIGGHVAVIERQVARMTQIIRSLLDFSRRSPPRRTTVDPGKVARTTAQLLRPMAQKAGMAITIDAIEIEIGAAGLSLTADESQLQQVITNLVINAIHAGHAGGEVRIRIRSLPAHVAPKGPGGETLNGPAVVITVEDDGIGMDKEVRRHLFEPFFTTKEIGKGTGLGLAVSHGIVRDHDGFIDVVSEVGAGASFSVFLPAESAPSQTSATLA